MSTNPHAHAAAPPGVCPDKRTGHSGRPRGGDRRTLQLQPLRVVITRNGRTDVLECGHELENPYRNPNHRRHCPECPALAEPLSEVARLRNKLAECVRSHQAQNAYVDQLEAALEQIIALADADEPISLLAARIARSVMEQNS
jgi:hypothetical protein